MGAHCAPHTSFSGQIGLTEHLRATFSDVSNIVELVKLIFFLRQKFNFFDWFSIFDSIFFNSLQEKFLITGEHQCRSVILIKLLCNFMEIALRHGCSPVNLLNIFRTPFPKNTYGGLLLKVSKQHAKLVSA